jgi:nucleoid-associated protein YgaU
MIVSEYTTRVAAVAQQIEVEAVARARAYADTLTGELTSVHVVRRGEDLRDLSQAAYNTPNEWRQIMSYNQLATPELTPGQVILIPRTSLQEEC